MKPSAPVAEASLRISVVYAARERQYLRELTVPAGTTAVQAIERSGLREEAHLQTSALQNIGIFGRRVAPATVLREGDRVEIYRALALDPRDARRRRAAK